MISKSALIGQNVTVKEGVVVEDNVVIGDNCYLDYGCIIRKNVTLGADSYVGPQSILGEFCADFYENRANKTHPLIIGEKATIRSGAVIYGSTEIGVDFITGHHVTIRENTKIGNHSRIGTLGDIQGDCIIGNYVSAHSNVHIGKGTKIHDYVWVFPYTVFTNDSTPPSNELTPVEVEEYAVISTGAICLPGVHIGKRSLIGAGAVVLKDVPENAVVVGNPGKQICDTDKIKNHITGENVYPWPYHFKRGMPWQDTDYDVWLKENG
jgi:acetyltransferase-like isoleucine patch superfamily enzyme